MNRRDFLKVLGVGTVAPPVAGFLQTQRCWGVQSRIRAGQPSNKSKTRFSEGVLRTNRGKPNIIFIMADDLGYQELGCYGQQKIKTLHIDRLAAEGMRFRQYYTGSAVCAPARCNLMTGKHGGHAYVRNNSEIGGCDSFRGQLPLPAETVTVASLLKEQGYVTGAFGKWGLGEVGSTGDPLNQGFDRFVGYNCQRHAHNLYPKYLIRDREKIILEGNTRGLTGKH